MRHEKDMFQLEVVWVQTLSIWGLKRRAFCPAHYYVLVHICRILVSRWMSQIVLMLTLFCPPPPSSFPPFLPLVFTHIICLASALGTSKTMRTFSCHRYPLMCPFWVGSLNCLLNKTLTSSPQPCPYSILASQLYWQKCLSTHFYGGLKEIDYYCAQIKWESNATPVWLSCNWSELYTGAICNIFSKLNFFLFGFYWCMFRCPLGLPFFQWKLQHVNFHTNYSNSRYLYLIHYNRSNQG